jgi:hypothetical protein
MSGCVHLMTLPRFYVRTGENWLRVKREMVIMSAHRFIKSSLFTFNSAQIIIGISECLFVD